VYYTAMLEDKQYAEAFRVLADLRKSHRDNFVLYVWATDWFRRQSRNLEGAEYFEKVFNEESKRSPLMAGYALLEKAQLLVAHNRKADAARTLERIKSLQVSDRLLLTKAQALEKPSR
jgi:predicted Zn-dependent protease